MLITRRWSKTRFCSATEQQKLLTENCMSVVVRWAELNVDASEGNVRPLLIANNRVWENLDQKATYLIHLKSIRLYKFRTKQARKFTNRFQISWKLALKYYTEEKWIICKKYFLEPQQPIFLEENPQNEGKSCWFLLINKILQPITERNVSTKFYERSPKIEWRYNHLQILIERRILTIHNIRVMLVKLYTYFYDVLTIEHRNTNLKYTQLGQKNIDNVFLGIGSVLCHNFGSESSTIMIIWIVKFFA